MNLDRLEARAAGGAEPQTVTVGRLSFTLRRLTPIEREAAWQTGLARAGAEALPEGLDGARAEHRIAWRVMCGTAAVIHAALTGWSLEDEATPEAVLRLVRLLPPHHSDWLFSASVPVLDLPDDSGGDSEGNG